MFRNIEAGDIPSNSSRRSERNLKKSSKSILLNFDPDNKLGH
jgi:hypothetical protein